MTAENARRNYDNLIATVNNPTVLQRYRNNAQRGADSILIRHPEFKDEVEKDTKEIPEEIKEEPKKETKSKKEK